MYSNMCNTLATSLPWEISFSVRVKDPSLEIIALSKAEKHFKIHRLSEDIAENCSERGKVKEAQHGEKSTKDTIDNMSLCFCHDSSTGNSLLISKHTEAENCWPHSIISRKRS